MDPVGYDDPLLERKLAPLHRGEVITTALIPGKPAPKLLSKDHV